MRKRGPWFSKGQSFEAPDGRGTLIRDEPGFIVCVGLERLGGQGAELKARPIESAVASLAHWALWLFLFPSTWTPSALHDPRSLRPQYCLASPSHTLQQ